MQKIKETQKILCIFPKFQNFYFSRPLNIGVHDSKVIEFLSIIVPEPLLDVIT